MHRQYTLCNHYIFLLRASAIGQGFSYCEPSFLAEMEAQSRLDTLLPSLKERAAPPPAGPEPLARLGVGAAVGGG